MEISDDSEAISDSEEDYSRMKYKCRKHREFHCGARLVYKDGVYHIFGIHHTYPIEDDGIGAISFVNDCCRRASKILNNSTALIAEGTENDTEVVGAKKRYNPPRMLEAKLEEEKEDKNDGSDEQPMSEQEEERRRELEEEHDSYRVTLSHRWESLNLADRLVHRYCPDTNRPHSLLHRFEPTTIRLDASSQHTLRYLSTMSSRFIPPPADLVKPIDAIKEYGKTMVAAGDPRECWRLLEYLFELPFFHLINAPAPLALLEPRQTPRKVLQAAREAAKRKAIIHEEALLDHDALDFEKRFLDLDAKRRRTADTPLIVQVNCTPTQGGLIPAKERVLVEGTFTGPPGPHATTIGKITSRLRAERALEERIARTGSIRTGILTPPVTPLPPLPTPEELHVPSTETLPTTPRAPSSLPSTPRRPQTEDELLRSLTRNCCTLRPVLTRITPPKEKPTKGKSLRKKSTIDSSTSQPVPLASTATESDLETLRIKIITEGTPKKRDIRVTCAVAPRSKTPDHRRKKPDHRGSSPEQINRPNTKAARNFSARRRGGPSTGHTSVCQYYSGLSIRLWASYHSEPLLGPPDLNGRQTRDPHRTRRRRGPGQPGASTWPY
ncbi:hypothetical protein DAPPUDRAFT_117663 [Daphnia pulex]|uniref:Uncharacterized protein n=1 Tax=Daphnia pulex TaxID=6669 RepID=E9HTE4_DAPPU|nr:hypothetical protein DAPPUDRAFT_117663 [Daphnia pulex]|eukprot:EFX64983.1 hypothetical protein DAPPUDRAFT_117663 [Daphnia pulex]